MTMNPVHTMQTTLIQWFQTDNPIFNYMITFAVLTGMTFITTHATKLWNIVSERLKRFFRKPLNLSVNPSLKFSAFYSESKSWSGSNEFFAWLEQIKSKALPPLPENRALTKDSVCHLEQFGNFYFHYNGDTIWIPSQDTDFHLDENIWVSFKREVTQEGENKDKKINVTLTIYVKSLEEYPILLRYHEKMVQQYLEKQNRKFNEPHIWRFSSYDESKGRIRWKDYKFNSTRSFDHVWFKEKEKFLDSYRHFRTCRDDYRKSGDPWFFSTLFYGPPGCGKTSTIKAILEESRRNGEVCHLFIVPFKSISSADMLLNLLHNETVENVIIPFDQRIYVFEDFDAENGAEMLKRRFFNTSDHPPYFSPIGFGPSSSLGGKYYKKYKFNSKKSNNKTEKKQEQQQQDCMCDSDYDSEQDDVASRRVSLGDHVEDKDTKKDKNDDDKEEKEHESRSFHHHRVSLADILNALDGVQELYGHTLIFTTNCPNPKKTFDSAFLREGRMHHLIKLGKCDHDGINYFFKQSYGESCPSTRIKDIGCNIYTPAQIKSACKIHKSAQSCAEFLYEKKIEAQQGEKAKDDGGNAPK